ncbi:MAG: hypothetical protein AAGE80_15450 [Pseudomonadota bacterium]
MTGLVYLDIAIGVVFLLLVFSLFASAIQEVISGITGWRGNNLRRGVRWLIEGTSDADKQEDFNAIWNSPLIESLHGPGSQFSLLLQGSETKRAPSYIPPEVFARVVWTIVAKERDITELNADAISELETSDKVLHQRLAAVLRGLEGGAEEAEAAIARWYDTAMARISGWYVRNTRMVLFWIGLALAVFTNTDPIRYAGELRQNEALRQEVVAKAEQIAALKDLDAVRMQLGAEEPETPPEDLSTLTEQVKMQAEKLAGELNDIEASGGWAHCGAYNPASGGSVEQGEFSFACFKATVFRSEDIANYAPGKTIPNPLFGWLLLSFGVMLGAQFWFDLLKRFVSIRSAGVSLGRKANDGKPNQTTNQ